MRQMQIASLSDLKSIAHDWKEANRSVPFRDYVGISYKCAFVSNLAFWATTTDILCMA